MAPANNITALILAGGAGRRVNHQDKGLINWEGKPLVAHVSDALRPQVKEILISCNRNFSRYAEFGSRTVADTRRDFQGPLAGLEAAAAIITTELLVVVSCDTPHIPADLVTRLTAPLLDDTGGATEISYADDGTRAQYLCAGLRSACLASLPAFLDGGQRAVKDWYSSRKAVAVDFSDQHSSFRNYNTLE
ncbi:MAG: molybdenum cofactor guanylyltransferase [Halioglobus sp.]|nr:molybdenum cofactor guanylyltransferase [Halioglobus sp.]